MYVEHKDVYYYLTIYNENHLHPAMPKGAEDGIIKGLYLFSEEKKPAKAHVQLLGSGSILREVIAAAELLKEEFGVTSDVWSVTSFNELARDGQDVDRWNLLNAEKKPKKAYVTQLLEGDDLNFQVKLFEDGVVEFHYADMTSGSSGNYGDGNSATVWIAAPDFSGAIAVGLEEPVIRPHTAWRFTPRQ